MVAVIVAAVALVAAACSPAPRPGQDVAAGDFAPTAGTAGRAGAEAGGSADGSLDPAVGDGGADPDGVPTTVPGPGQPGAPAAGGDGDAAAGETIAGPTPGAGGGGQGSGSGGGTGSGTGSGTGTGGVTGFVDPPSAGFYDASAARRGITDTSITMCSHAALTLAPAFDTRPADLNVYWEQVNETPEKIYGRSVHVSYEDDAYSPDVAVGAAETCSGKKPFLILGGIGFDQIPAVRNYAETHKELYLHHIANEDDTKNFSFTGFPSVERVGVGFGEFIAGRYGTKRVGIIYRNSEFWEPGHRTGKAVMDARGVNIVGDHPVTKNQGVYSNELFALQNSQNAEVVWIWENALIAAQVIQQADAQGYRPTWVVFPFQQTLDLVGEAALRQPIVGVAAWPAYMPPAGRAGQASFGPYEAELARFEDAYARYRSGKTNDILWQVWLGNKSMHDMLVRCGPNCDRNLFAGMMLNGFEQEAAPNCHLAFWDDAARRTTAHRGGYRLTAQEVYESPIGPGWRNTDLVCAEKLG